MRKAKGAKIKFIADECTSEKVIRFLRSLGFAVTSVWDLNLRGAKNGTLIKRAIKDKSVFITEDLDFCNIILYPPRLHHGIIVLKEFFASPEEICTLLGDLLAKIKPADFDKTLIVVDKNRYRIRRE